jgi:hypothetical protein
MTPTERVLDIVNKHEKAGGITLAGLRAVYQPEEAERPVDETVWEMLAQGLVRMDGPQKRLRMPEATIPRQGRATSGIGPIGPGDTLFNCDGKAVALVKDIERSERTGALTINVEPLFDHLYSLADGTTAINQPGTILGTAGGLGLINNCGLNHSQLLAELVEKGFPSGECPDCGLFLHKPVKPMDKWRYNSQFGDDWRR